MFQGVDRAVFAAAFGDRLSRAGLRVPLSSHNRLVAGLAAAGPVSKRELYLLCRVSLVSRQSDLATFDAVFSAVFDMSLEQMKTPESRRAVAAPSRPEDTYMSLRVPDADSQAGQGLPWATLPSVVENDGSDSDSNGDDAAIPERLPSVLDAELDTPFDLLDPELLALVEAALSDALVRWPARPSRRHQTWSSGKAIDLRTSLRAARRTGGEPIHLTRTRPQTRPRRIVVLVDVSGSMQAFARPYLHLTRSLAMTGRAEVFAFATELTRITASLRRRSAAEAVDLASEQVADRFGGTRLAHSINQLLHHSVWGSYVRGSIVVVASDGWDTDPPELVEQQIRKLRRRCHKLIWLNPRSAATEFEPLVGPMAAALPHCDSFLPGHSLRSMADVVDAICA